MPRFSDLRYDQYPPAPKPLNSCVDTIRCRRVYPFIAQYSRLNGLWLSLPPTFQQPENDAGPVTCPIWPRFTLVSKVPANQDIHLIGNRRMGGDSAHNFAYLSYTSHLGTTNIQRPYIGCPRLAIVCTLHHVAPSWCHRMGRKGEGDGESEKGEMREWGPEGKGSS